jgi:hypothetical protein
MANFVWTAILYSATLLIVYVCYRVFVFDRKTESESKVNEMINRSYAKGAVPHAPGRSGGLGAVRPGGLGQTGKTSRL